MKIAREEIKHLFIDNVILHIENLHTDYQNYFINFREFVNTSSCIKITDFSMYQSQTSCEQDNKVMPFIRATKSIIYIEINLC